MTGDGTASRAGRTVPWLSVRLLNLRFLRSFFVLHYKLRKIPPSAQGIWLR
jgi:hypothetical protein